MGIPTGDSAVGRTAVLDLGESLIAALRAQLTDVAAATLPAVVAEVPAYRDAFGDREQQNLAAAVALALKGLVNVAARGPGSDGGAPLTPALSAAYDLGRGEARSGRTMEALLAAYRVGARVSWREFAAIAVANGMPPAQLAGFAELVFAYIDELSAASVAGHADEMARSGRDLRRNLEQLGRDLVAGAPVESLNTLATAARWQPPAALAAVVAAPSHARQARSRVDLTALEVNGDLPGLPERSPECALLVPVPEPAARDRLVAALAGLSAVVGPARPWLAIRASVLRATRALLLDLGPGIIDTELHLPELSVTADPELLADLRERVLAPLSGLKPETAARLSATLRSWLRNQGRREDVARELYVHPQTVRYRMGQVRELFGARLEDPSTHLELMIGLAAVPASMVPASQSGD